MLTRPRAAPALAATAAVLLAALLAPVIGFQIYWTLGGTWGLSVALGHPVEDSSAALRAASAAVAVALAGAIAIVLGRVRMWRSRVPFSVFRWGGWALTGLFVLVGLNNAAAGTTWERYVFAPFALTLAILAGIVALADVRPEHADPDAEPGAGARRDRLDPA